ncbi:MAG: MFS transporter [Caulobacter sp.]|nr:MFS transporter [Caulobacter sp.]
MTDVTTPAAPPSRYRYYVLAILIVVYTFNFIDRQILGILKDSIQTELGLTDTQVGLMGGIAFAALYSTLGIPIAWLADRYSRTWIMTGALTLWSGFTAACALATSFWGLFALRMGVGIGEAGGVAPAYSLISDYFPPRQRGRALAAFSFGIPLGMALGILLGGLIAASIDWRAAFVVVGLAGLLIAPIFKLTVRDPKRGGLDAGPADQAPADPAAAPAKAASVPQVFNLLRRKPSFWLLAFGAAASSVCGYGVAFWLPTFFQRSLGLTLTETAWYYSAITLFGGVAGIWMGGALADRFGAKNRGAYALAPALAFLVALPFFFLALNAPTLPIAFFLFLIPTGLNLAWLGPVITAVQHLAPPPMRATASALFLLVNNLLGIALGTYYFGWASDLLKPWFGQESIRYAIYSGGGFYLVAATLLLLASRSLRKDWVD